MTRSEDRLRARESGPDRAAVRTFCALLFGYAEGFVPIRLYGEKGGDRFHPVTPFERADDRLADAVLRHVEHALRHGAAAFVVPGTVTRPGRARAEDIVQLTTVLVDLDEGDVAAKRRHLIRHLGEPSLEVASGGSTADGQDRLHLYWRLTEPAAGPDVARVCRLRDAIARKAGGDRSFASPHQPIRIAGSVYCKDGVRRPVRILGHGRREVDLAEFAGQVDAMPDVPGLADASPTPLMTGAAAKASAATLLSHQVREGGVDGVTRFDALSSVIGLFLRRAREGRISLEAAWAEIAAYNLARIEPPWPEDRLRREFHRLLEVDRRNHGSISAPDCGEDAEEKVSAPDAVRPTTEDALAEVFTSLHGSDWRYCARWGHWLEWSGTHWRADERGRIHHLARLVCRDAARAHPPGQARRIASAAAAAAVERLARTDPRHAAGVEEWDANPWLLNTPGGAVHLRTGEVQAHERADRMTRCTSAGPGRGCPTWLSFLDTVTGGDRELQSYLARMLGYCLTGLTIEQKLFFIHGAGANGKSVLLSVVGEVLGSYATTAPLDTFMASASDRHTTDLAGLRGARLVTMGETEEGRQWAETKLKSVTGGDRIKARFLYRDFFEYTPTFKLIVAGNHRPEFRDTGEALRRRLHLVPFTVTIPPEQRDGGLTERLLAERDGILGWMVEGCLAWQRIGLKSPACVGQATREYFAEEDRIGRWLAEDCVLAPGVSTPVGLLYASFRAWAERLGEEPGSAKAFSQALHSRGFERSRSGARAYRGIRVMRSAPGSFPAGDGR